MTVHLGTEPRRLERVRSSDSRGSEGFTPPPHEQNPGETPAVKSLSVDQQLMDPVDALI